MDFEYQQNSWASRIVFVKQYKISGRSLHMQCVIFEGDTSPEYHELNASSTRHELMISITRDIWEWLVIWISRAQCVISISRTLEVPSLSATYENDLSSEFHELNVSSKYHEFYESSHRLTQHGIWEWHVIWNPRTDYVILYSITNYMSLPIASLSATSTQMQKVI